MTENELRERIGQAVAGALVSAKGGDERTAISAATEEIFRLVAPITPIPLPDESI